MFGNAQRLNTRTRDGRTGRRGNETRDPTKSYSSHYQNEALRKLIHSRVARLTTGESGGFTIFSHSLTDEEGPASLWIPYLVASAVAT